MRKKGSFWERPLLFCCRVLSPWSCPLSLLWIRGRPVFLVPALACFLLYMLRWNRVSTGYLRRQSRSCAFLISSLLFTCFSPVSDLRQPFAGRPFSERVKLFILCPPCSLSLKGVYCLYFAVNCYPHTQNMEDMVHNCIRQPRMSWSTADWLLHVARSFMMVGRIRS